MINKTHIEGKDKGSIMLYALSTCGWCRKTKELLNKMGLAYDYINVDQLSDEEATRVENEEVKKWNPAVSYPTIVVNGQRAIVNYDEKKIKELGQ